MREDENLVSFIAKTATLTIENQIGGKMSVKFGIIYARVVSCLHHENSRTRILRPYTYVL